MDFPEDLLSGGAPGRMAAILPFSAEISVEKRPVWRSTSPSEQDVPLKIFAKIDDADEEYFRAEIEPLS